MSRHARVQVRFLDQAQGLVPAWREMTQEKQVAELQRLEVQKLQVQRETELARQVTRFACHATNHIVRALIRPYILWPRDSHRPLRKAKR